VGILTCEVEGGVMGRDSDSHWVLDELMALADLECLNIPLLLLTTCRSGNRTVGELRRNLSQPHRSIACGWTL
jgi:hypothetical protein